MPTLLTHSMLICRFPSYTHFGENTHQLDNAELSLASSSTPDVFEFYRRPVTAAKTSEIDLIHVESFDIKRSLWPSNQYFNVII